LSFFPLHSSDNNDQQERGIPIAAALEKKTLLDSFKGNFELSDVNLSYSKDLNVSKLKVKHYT